ncbi:MAG: lipid-A-disaccharide synthase [Zhongshania aliphaticivorans]|jgi:lipid-A-disaccharide synthase|uniref:Lipid-A-disaccharide synthase n=1 Tax=Zhongshania aliphaticivorans TaxID=1470434 RepID=A0A127M764_9GAMM|nr:lipid-A-disaccharide synthase [Zhongshania aliphaticivorans]AMO69060.1 lipid-A-disaccharide synthase [Zhongshania aliphaticivorans]EIF43677.1 lipid-A-disaccharide synthase [gamma proteobacterium BDW918]|tara:strand:- start:2095 stop:3252 length:1158 start_codon:yes stop_codon:yes gene_type:complete
MTALRIGIIAGEASGDILGADLIRAIKSRYPNAEFEGVGGPLMIEQGCRSLCEMDRLSVMGIVEPLKRLPELLRLRRFLKSHFLSWQPAIVIGIDSPDFTLNIERYVRERGIKTLHYVSPSVWAWRQGRVKGIAKSVDHMLTLFPFEERFYQEHGVPVTCVGHPLADQIPLTDQRSSARAELDVEDGHPVLAILPGSRSGEVAQLIRPFLETAQWLRRAQPNIEFLIPAANAERKIQILQAIGAFSQDLPVRVVSGQSRTVMAASDVVLMASGTTSLEALLLQRPMVVAYRFGKWSYKLLSRLVKTPFFSLPNLLAQRALVPEVLQDEVRAEVMGPLLLEQLNNANHRESLINEFQCIHRQLAQAASERAADVVLACAGVSNASD